jgi:hypothetical protein
MSSMTDIQIQQTFDYGALDAETRIVVRQKTGEIRERARRAVQDVIEIGQRLIEVKECLEHGQFGAWLDAEFRWSERTAQNYMAVAGAFKSETVADLAISTRALYALAAPSVPEEARQEAVEQARNGHRVGHTDAREIVDRHRPQPARPTPPPVVRSEARPVEYEDESQEEPEEDDAGDDDVDSGDDEPEEIVPEPTNYRPEPKSTNHRPAPSAQPFTLEPPIPDRDWEWLTRDLIRMHQSIREDGGMEACSSGWSEQRREILAKQFEWFRDEVLNQWIAALRRPS